MSTSGPTAALSSSFDPTLLRSPEDLVATLRRYQDVLNSALDTAIITLDEHGLVTGWNLGAERLLGWTEGEMLGRSLGVIFPEEAGGPAALLAEIGQAKLQGTGGSEGWRLRKGGGRFWAIGETRRMASGEGSSGFVKILRDRTDAQQLALALQERTRALEILNQTGSTLARETELDKVVQAVTDAGVALTGAEFGAFFYNLVNAAGESYMLYSLSGVPREKFAQFPMPRNTAVFAPTFSGEDIVRSDDITRDARYGRNAPNAGMPAGHLPVRSYLAVPVISRSGEVIGGLFFGHSRVGVFTEDSERNLEGLAGEAAVAIDNMRLFEKAQLEIAERSRVEAALRELNLGLEAQVQRRTAELLQHAEALRQAQKMEAVGQLTGGIAHDFNNLLQVIVGNLDLLSRGLPEEMARLRRAAAQAMSGAKRASSLTQRLLAFARRQPLDPKPLIANVVVQGMSELLRHALGETVELEVVGAGGLWTTEVDPNELESTLLNLAVNARDAMPSGGKLTIETANGHLDEAYAARHAEVTPGQYVVISVTDTGAGMDAQTMSRVFEPFFTTKPEGKGTGLGLSQVYGFVKQSHGHVQLYSELGIGTTVKLYLPRYHQLAQPTEHDEALPVPGAEGERILVLEDDADVRAFSVSALQELGYRVIEAAHGAAALAVLEKQGVDLLFTDVVLPGGLTGADVAARAKVLQPGIKVLFTTGYSRNAIVHHGRLDAGVNLLTKPFSLDDLAVKVREVLDKAVRDGTPGG
ncbi:ATP-binding protein [Ideonella azotifigens]|uniref:histidine kinase n=1 Tax=Ideonella azotifigens TaxID=513160 RepID=A0ABP3VHA9_9BURK|nr:ATP-binding protein [Ideonella azotifigens]MCD2344435.1 ATP-binding protein [Ideonella azotifigens]